MHWWSNPVCDDDEKKIEIDKRSFMEMLRRVTLAEARLYAQMSYLGSLAYSIPQIKVHYPYDEQIYFRP